jgi:hypothetical protein
MDFIPKREALLGVMTDYLLAEGVIVPPCKVGDHIWVIDREDGEAVDVSCVQYMANCKNFVIATAFINDYDFDETLEYHTSETQERFDTELEVYLEEDCFLTREEAEKALAERREG